MQLSPQFFVSDDVRLVIDIIRFFEAPCLQTTAKTTIGKCAKRAKPAAIHPKVSQNVAAMENELDQAKRHVTDGRRLIATQEDLIKSLKALGQPTHNAEVTLETFWRLQAVYEDHLRALMSKPTSAQL